MCTLMKTSQGIINASRHKGIEVTENLPFQSRVVESQISKQNQKEQESSLDVSQIPRKDKRIYVPFRIPEGS